MNIEDFVGTLAGAFITIAVLPQIYKAIKTKKVKDVSAFTYIILCLGVALWTIYGIMQQDWPIIITNGISLILNGIMLVIIFTQEKN